MKNLYHYSSNSKCFSILESQTLRMSDIQKSNDYMELGLFFPEIFNHIMRLYNENPFPLLYESKSNSEALDRLLSECYNIWDERFLSGDFSNFVACFSECPDALTQWQAYADNANGCCLAFSLPLLLQYCKQTNGVLRIEKVQYLGQKDLDDLVVQKARDSLSELNGLREWIVENMTHDNTSPDTDGLMSFNFGTMLGYIFTDSLMYKAKAFSHEKEWRIFFSDRAYKNADWVLGKEDQLIGPEGFSETLSFLRNKIDFNVTANDLVPYFPIKFSEFNSCPVTELWIGPKSNISRKDAELFLRKNDYNQAKVMFSNVTYR